MASFVLSLWQRTPIIFLLLLSIFQSSNSVSVKKPKLVNLEGGILALDTYLKEFYPAIPKPSKPIGDLPLPPFRAPSGPSFAVINQYLNDVIPAYFKASQACSDLTVYVGILMNRIRIERGTEKEVEAMLMNMCTVRQKPQVICAGLIKRFVPTFHFLVSKRPTLTPDIFVGTVFQQLGCRTNSSYVEWSVKDPFIGPDLNDTLIEDAPDGSDGDLSTDPVIIIETSTTTPVPTPVSETTVTTMMVDQVTTTEQEEEEGGTPHPAAPIMREISTATTSIKPPRSRQPRTPFTTTTVVTTQNEQDSDTTLRNLEDIPTEKTTTTAAKPDEEEGEADISEKTSTTVPGSPYDGETILSEQSTTKIPVMTTTTTTKIPESTTMSTTTEESEEAWPPQPPQPPQDPPLESPRPIKILHMTDLHVDPLYFPGTNAACDNKLLCCHEDSGKPPNRTVSAGVYGSNLYCDTPIVTLASALRSVQALHPDIDVFYMSGDIVPHNLWYTNKPDNIKTIEAVSGMIRSYFPQTQIIPILGNHEPHPVDLFSPKNLSIPSHLSTRWIYPATKRSWMTWITPEAANEYTQFGHYSIQLREKLRVLVLNTNICFGVNLWQLYSFNEFKEQLKWLQKELQRALEEDQHVHILGHLPPGYSGCTKVFSRNYYNIIANYSAIIGGQFFGHLHVDTFRLYYNPRRRVDPINVQWITPSFTSYKSNNPAYKIYYADPQNLQVIDHETYIFDLEKANAQPHLEPLWFKFYSAAETYQVPNVTLSNLAFVLDRLAGHPQVFETFYQYYLKAADYLQSQKCDTYCRKKILCRMVRPYYGAEEECERLQIKIDGVVVPVFDEYPLF